jgi:hypothetical protein
MSLQMRDGFFRLRLNNHNAYQCLQIAASFLLVSERTKQQSLLASLLQHCSTI